MSKCDIIPTANRFRDTAQDEILRSVSGMSAIMYASMVTLAFCQRREPWLKYLGCERGIISLCSQYMLLSFITVWVALSWYIVNRNRVKVIIRKSDVILNRKTVHPNPCDAWGDCKWAIGRLKWQNLINTIITDILISLTICVLCARKEWRGAGLLGYQFLYEY